MSKKYNNGSAWALPCILATTALVALLGFTTKGYTDWSFGFSTQEPPVSEEVPSTEEQPGTSEELPVEPTLPEDTTFDLLEDGNYDSSIINDLGYGEYVDNDLKVVNDYVYEKEASTNWSLTGTISISDAELYDAYEIGFGSHINYTNGLDIVISADMVLVFLNEKEMEHAFEVNSVPATDEPCNYYVYNISLIRNNADYYLTINDVLLKITDETNVSNPSYPFFKAESVENDVSHVVTNLSCIHDEEYINYLVSSKISSPKEKKNSDFVISDEIIGFENYDESL